MIRRSGVVLGLVAALLLTACSSGGGREIEVVASDTGCTPAAIRAALKEKLTFKFVNQAKDDRELEGIEGAKIEEVLIPAGRTRRVNYTTPSKAGIVKVKCYAPGGPSTIIEVQVSAS